MSWIIKTKSEFSKFLSNTDKSVCSVKDLHYWSIFHLHNLTYTIFFLFFFNHIIHYYHQYNVTRHDTFDNGISHFYGHFHAKVFFFQIDVVVVLSQLFCCCRIVIDRSSFLFHSVYIIIYENQISKRNKNQIFLIFRCIFCCCFNRNI